MTRVSAEVRTGSSPRARGTLFSGDLGHFSLRFIPASAGNTPSSPSSAASPTVHPRERGEHCPMDCATNLPPGSSPRARGTLPGDRPRRKSHRFIPASAGNTLYWPTKRVTPSVHPRERGEHFQETAPGEKVTGSSPRARGTLSAISAARSLPRFIPASAGNTQFRNSPATITPVHPRERGEHDRLWLAAAVVFGSSPRARGTLPLEFPRWWQSRFIPASAGNTTQDVPTPEDPSVHPRERGEHTGLTPTTTGTSGSSPRARGTLMDREAFFSVNRFIPASAGNTASPPPAATA